LTGFSNGIKNENAASRPSEIERLLQTVIDDCREKQAKRDSKEVADRAWRYAEYVINFILLVAYAVTVRYYFRVCIYMPVRFFSCNQKTVCVGSNTSYICTYDGLC
jgi:hypothetical protein